MLKKLKSNIDSAVAKIARVLPRFNPNFITIIGVVPPILFLWLLMHGYFDWALLALVGTFLDSLDGAYARATNQETKFGAVLDASLDRFSDAIIISAFGFAGLISWTIVIAVLIASFLISYVRSSGTAVLMQDSKFLALGPIERTQRLAIIFIGLLLFILFPNIMIANISLLNLIFLILLAASIVTVLRRLNAVRSI